MIKKHLIFWFLNVASVCVLSDYFVIASAGSTTQVKGLTSSLRERIKELFLAASQTEMKMTLKTGGTFLIMVML